ncbi:uncharacterized protein MKZ38_008463 [Zalerion maritima]|uniref:Uncharacterized protein n=1 Tax=Zalerion maritima TaxID=339359 RepID=A0AAD5RVU6_9PEZI|nr:uncharacterized protein MKZ38_008463 [Zalerion maritima]
MTMAESEHSADPKRVLVSVSHKSPHWSMAWVAGGDVMAIALQLLKDRSLVSPNTGIHEDCLLLATDRWDLRTFIVFDVFHKTYDPRNAHIPGRNDLPVVSVFLHGKETVWPAGRQMENRVNKDVRNLHNSMGWGSQPPFTVDHADGKAPTYYNLRTSTEPPAW